MNLLDRAKQLLQSRAPDALASEQYYHVACPEGHRLSGKRTVGYQALRCPTCGEGIFVLPRSPLPNPPAPEPSRPSPHALDATFSAPLDDPVLLSDPPLPSSGGNEEPLDIDWEEEPSRPVAQPSKAAQPVAQSVRPTARKAIAVPKGEREDVAERPSRVRPPAEERGRAVETAPDDAFDEAPARPGEWLRRHRNPLIFLGVTVIVLGTVAVRIQRNRFEDYPRIAEIGRTEGLRALDEGQFDTAQLLLSKAKRAVRALGGKCEGADEILRGAAETEIFANLIAEPLETLLEEADPAEDSAWSRTFATLYKGRTIIIDAPLLEVTGDDGAPRHALDYRIFPGGERPEPLREGVIDLNGFALFDQTALKSGTRVEFGARIASFTYDSSRRLWLVGLERDSGVFITHHDALKARWPSQTDLAGEAAP